LAAGFAIGDGGAAWRAARAQAINSVDARVVAINIPGASAIAQVGTFLQPPPASCAHPIPMNFPTYIAQGAVLDPARILVGSRSNFGAPLATEVGQEGSFLSIDPSRPGVRSVPPNFAHSGVQQSQREHSNVRRGEQSPRPVQQQRLRSPLASECTVWRYRRRFIFNPGSNWASAIQASQQFDRRGLCGRPDEPQRGDRSTAPDHPRLYEHGRGGNSLAWAIA